MAEKPTPLDGTVEKVKLTRGRIATLIGICVTFVAVLAVMYFGGK